MTPPADDARIAGIEDRLNTLAASIEQNQAMATGMQAIADQLTALNARLERLENASAAMPQQQMAVPAPAAPAPAITRSAPPPAPTAPVAAAEPAKPRKASAPRPKWSLRAVSNGVAYLAPAKGGDLRPVRVGETLPGLGTVTSIEQVNGNWVVRGSTGRVSQ
jgi:TolA-binding protein